MELQTTRKTLKYVFTEREMQELSRNLATTSQELRQKEEQKKSVVSDYASQITVCKEQIGSLSDKVASGYEMRDVKCTVEYHLPEKNMKRITRTDTGEDWSEPMTEMDFNLFNQWQQKEQDEFNEQDEIEGDVNVAEEEDE